MKGLNVRTFSSVSRKVLLFLLACGVLSAGGPGLVGTLLLKSGPLPTNSLVLCPRFCSQDAYRKRGCSVTRTFSATAFYPACLLEQRVS